MSGRGVAGRLTGQERRRRACIAYQYASITSPTKDDDDRFAKELGLSIDSLWRLARAWRLGFADELEMEDRAAARIKALDAAREPDLFEISPSRRPLMEKRLEVIAGYLEIPEPTPADLMTAATALNMTAQSFRRLLRGWIRHRNPALLQGGSTPVRKGRYSRTDLVSRETQMIQALANLGTQVSSMALHREVVRLCEIDGVTPPVQATVYARLMRARAEASRNDGQPGFALDHSAVGLAVLPPTGGSPTVGVLSILFWSVSGRIVAHSLSLDPPSHERTAALLSKAASILPPGSERLIINIPAEPEWQPLKKALEAGNVAAIINQSKGISTGKLITGRFGDLIGTLRLRPGQTRSPATAKLTRVMGAHNPLTLPQALNAVAAAIDLHNSGRVEPTVGFIPATGPTTTATEIETTSE